MNLDPEYADAVRRYLGEHPRTPASDPHELRRRTAQRGPAPALPTEVARDEVPSAVADDGHRIALSRYRHRHPSGATLLYLHGGGYVAGSRASAAPAIARMVAATGITVFTPEYRLAPEFPAPTPVNDCHAALIHLATLGRRLDIDPERLAIGGDSAGAGLAAAVAIQARDTTGPRIAAQLLGSPMLGDRTSGPAHADQTWTPGDNDLAWRAYLGEQAPALSPAPARAADLSRLPRTFIDVGSVDLFCLESIAYAGRLIDAGVACELHVYDGAPHGFANLNPSATTSRRALEERSAFLRRI